MHCRQLARYGQSTSTRRTGARVSDDFSGATRKSNWPRPGFSEATLWVLKENARAIGFYEAHGFALEPGSGKTITRGGAEIIKLRLLKPLDS